MPSSAGYPIEDFLEAITAQLDQTQDALRLKAVNRPLTFALKDFNVNLQVFVEMNPEGKVTFRPAAPNEAGASTVSIGFTTITRPMIEENTVSMEMSQAPSLDELGLKADEQRQLAKIGVRNGAQLRNLQRSAGEETLSRQTGVDLGRIKGALNLARPRLEDIAAHAPVEVPVIRPEPPPRQMQPGYGLPEQPVRQVQPGNSLADRLRQGMAAQGRPGAGMRRLEIDPGAREIQIGGRNLIEGGRAPRASLDGRALDTVHASALAASFALPPGQGGGHLVIELPDGEVESFHLIERGKAEGGADGGGWP
ncbi:MAG: hypothetical protein ACRCS3_12245 [Paracoccaceae bacterium]